jgi:hypothetical protein
MPPKSLQATRDGRFRRRCAMAGQASSAIAEDVICPACLSSGRWPLFQNNTVKDFNRILPDGYLNELNLWKTKTGDLNFRTAGQTFSPPITRPAPEFSHSLAT